MEVVFSFPAIVEKLNKKGEAKKELVGMIKWEGITKSQINPSHTAFALITGKLSNLTIFDFDDRDVYFQFVEMFPDLKKYKTTETKNGFHVYCNYDEDIHTTTNGFINHKGVDIKNDGGIVFCPPTQRKCIDGSVFVYKDLGGEVLPVPDIFIDNMKQFHETETISTEPLYSCQSDYKYIDEAIEKGWLNDRAFASWDEWRDVGFAIKHTLGDTGKTLFHKFSKINENLYDESYTNGFWKSIKQGKNPLTIGSIKFWVKKHLEKMEKELKTIEEDAKRTAFLEMANQFEKTHSKILNREMFVKQENNQVVCLTKSGLITAYEHLIYEWDEKGKKESNFIKSWMKNNPNIRCYDDIGVYPNPERCPPRILNVWCKFDMELITEWEHHEEGLQMILNHIRILCGNDDIVADYFIKWLAQMIQYPETKTICPTLISREGAGKGTLVQLIRRMLGNKKVFETADAKRDVWGQFNGHMADCFFVNLDELSKKDTLDSQGKIKALITNSSLTINIKGLKEFQVESFHRFFITTNNEDPIATKEDDRRNLIIRSSDELIGDKDYFAKFYVLIADDNVVKTFFEYLKSIPDMDEFGKIPIPQTEHQTHLKELGESVEERWLRDFIETADEDVELMSKEAYSLFSSYCKENGIEYQSNTIKLMVTLKNKIKTGIGKKHTSQGNKVLFHVAELKKYFGIGCQIVQTKS
jgi:hypothetical protein